MYHLAQVNIARALAPLDDPLLAAFMAQLDAINALADASPGFVWRLQADGGNATSIRAYDDERIIVNMSLWESGVSWLVLDGQDFGFYGPVVDEAPQGAAALEIWSHMSWLLTQPYLYEIKRERA